MLSYPTRDAPRWFGAGLVVTLLIKLWLARLIPMSGDEAYFLYWGKYPDLGFYDHPPMVGWLLNLMLHFGDGEVTVRLPVVLLSGLIGLGIYWLLKGRDPGKAALVALLFVASPVNVLNVLITTDTPLIFFCFVSAAALYGAMQRDNLGLYALAGVGLGLAFLSKYFAVLLGIAYFVCFLAAPKNPRRTAGFALLFACITPFVALHLYWNYNHCWANIMFNLYNRNEDDHASPLRPLIYLGTQAYLITPPVLWYLWKHRAELKSRLSPDFRPYLYAFLVPMAAFALLSVGKVIGLHWVLAFYPFLYILLFSWLDAAELRKCLVFMMVFTLAHLLAIAVLSQLPVETWKHNRKYHGIIQMFKTDELIAKLRPYEANYPNFATDGYSPSVIMSYHYAKYGRYFGVFGEGSAHARHDDILTDWRRMDGQNVLILHKEQPKLDNYQPYFARVEQREIDVRGARFYLVLGENFNYPLYRDRVLAQVKRRYYNIPAFLPVGRCYYCERYFGDPVCADRPALQHR